MTTMTMPPITYSNVAIDASYNDDKFSIKSPLIENTTNITTKIRDTYLYIISEMEKELANSKVYPTSSMNNNTIGENMNDIYYYSKRQIEVNNNKYLFENEFIYLIKFEDDMYIAENSLFNIFGYGNTITEAENDLYENIDDLWDVYVEADDNNLDDGALLLKKNLMENIRKIS